MAVYFVECAGYIKIGFAADPQKRLADLQIGNPLPLTLLGCVPGAASEESEFHARWSHLHVRGEWFAATSELRAYVDSVLLNFKPAVLPKSARVSTSSAFGESVRSHRCAAGWTQVQLAERLGVSPATVFRIERGERPSPRVERSLREWNQNLAPIDRAA